MGVDAGELIEEADGDGEVDRQPVAPLEEPFARCFIRMAHSLEHLLDFAVGVAVAPSW